VHFFLKSAFGHLLMSVVRASTTHELGKDVAEQVNRFQAAVHVHCQRYRRIHVSAANSCDQEDHQCQGSTNDQRIATTGKNGENEKEGSNVLGEVRGEGHLHGF